MSATRSYDLHFAEASDAGLDAEIITAREAKEAESLSGFRKLAGRISTTPELHRWMFTEHGAYAAPGQSRKERTTDRRALTSY